MKILGIETSCDETATSIIDAAPNSSSFAVLGNTVHSQIELHASYGGVFPTLAKREHARNLVPVLKKTLKEAAMEATGENPLSTEDAERVKHILRLEPELLEAFLSYIPTIQRPDLDFISVTYGPGLEPALWVGIGFARALSCVWNIPVIPSNHMEGHILTAVIKRTTDKTFGLIDKTIAYPALSLLISGGHTQIVLIEKIGSYKIAGETRDDAVGECFDKIARTLGLPYPGGPKISKLAAEARKENIQSPEPLPRPMKSSDDLDFSFSGLKTAVLYLVERLKTKNIALDETTIKGIAREAEDAITDVLISKMRKAAEQFSAQTIIVGGGVIANAQIRSGLEALAHECGLTLLLPEFDHSTDNGLMITLAGYFNIGHAQKWETEIKADGTLSLGPRL